MSRRERQRRELLELCESGTVKRAVDLAFQHFADFGCDPEVLSRIERAITTADAASPVRRRFEELSALDHHQHDRNGTAR